MSSNRTFMELKLISSASYNVASAGSNRTFMELKWEGSGAHC